MYLTLGHSLREFASGRHRGRFGVAFHGSSVSIFVSRYVLFVAYMLSEYTTALCSDAAIATVLTTSRPGAIDFS